MTREMNSLAAIVTGGASGIGAAVATKPAGHGRQGGDPWVAELGASVGRCLECAFPSGSDTELGSKWS